MAWACCSCNDVDPPRWTCNLKINGNPMRNYTHHQQPLSPSFSLPLDSPAVFSSPNLPRAGFPSFRDSKNARANTHTQRCAHKRVRNRVCCAREKREGRGEGEREKRKNVYLGITAIRAILQRNASRYRAQTCARYHRKEEGRRREGGGNPRERSILAPRISHCRETHCRVAARQVVPHSLIHIIHTHTLTHNMHTHNVRHPDAEPIDVTPISDFSAFPIARSDSSRRCRDIIVLAFHSRAIHSSLFLSMLQIVKLYRKSSGSSFHRTSDLFSNRSETRLKSVEMLSNCT